MNSFSNKTRWYLAVAAAAGISFVIVMEFTDWHRLDAVTLDGQPVDDPQAELGLDPEASVFEQPLREVALGLLANDSTVIVDIDYTFPASLKLETNRFTPACLVLDQESGRMFGLNRQGWVVPLRDDYDDWERPFVVGVVANRIFETCDDPRVSLLVEQLVLLADENGALYRLIDEIEMSSPTYLTVTISGLPYRLKTSADDFLEQMLGFVRFLESYDSQIASARIIDLRFANMIVQESKGN